MPQPNTCAPHAADIAERYSCGESARKIAKALGLSLGAVGRWISGVTSGDEEAERLTRARKAHAAGLIDESIGIIDDVDPESNHGSARVAKAREQVGLRKYIASRLDRATWGERVDIGITGSITSHLEVGGMLAHAITGGSAAGAVSPQALGTARVTVDAERVDDDTHDVDAGDDDGAHGGREADAGDVLDPAT